LRDVQDAVAALTPEQLDELRIVVITLDPENDTPEVLANVAAARGSLWSAHMFAGDA
jgi:cytochrome oxidase Cu insertion factor (SCO1/SenC/PrrC family)